jgi:hypothetical protein
MTDKKESFIYNKNAIMLYKDTETRFVNDDEVSADDLTVMCNMLYQTELLTVFCIIKKDDVKGDEEKEPDFMELTNRMESVYDIVKMDARIIALIKQYFFQDELSTFFSLFSYDTFYIVHKIICDCL